MKFEPAKIIEGNVLELKNMDEMKETFEACIINPPCYFSMDYAGKDKIAYNYLGIDMKKLNQNIWK